MLLSIIVPVYNVEQYLSKCLDSLLNQDLTTNDYEIIIINDGSTDSSLAIAESYAQKHKNITIITQKNKGLGGARNTGIRYVTGKYLWFVDSDDYVKPNSLKELLDFIEKKDLEILRFNYEAVKENGDIIVKKNNSLHSIVYNEIIVTGQEFLSKQLGWACYVVMFLFDTDFIKRNDFYFNEEIYFEDVEWLVRVLLKTQKICSYDNVIYYYLQRKGSITQSVSIEKKEKIYNDKIFIITFLFEASEKNISENAKKWCKGLATLTIIGLLKYVTNQLPDKKKEFLSFLKEKCLPVSEYRFTKKQKRDIFIINISPALFCWLIRKK